MEYSQLEKLKQKKKRKKNFIVNKDNNNLKKVMRICAQYDESTERDR